MNSSKKGEHGKDFMEIKFNTDDNLALNKPLNLYLLTITAKCIFKMMVNFIRNFISTTVCISYVLEATYKC